MLKAWSAGAQIFNFKPGLNIFTYGLLYAAIVYFVLFSCFRSIVLYIFGDLLYMYVDTFHEARFTCSIYRKRVEQILTVCAFVYGLCVVCLFTTRICLNSTCSNQLHILFAPSLRLSQSDTRRNFPSLYPVDLLDAAVCPSHTCRVVS